MQANEQDKQRSEGILRRVSVCVLGLVFSIQMEEIDKFFPYRLKDRTIKFHFKNLLKALGKRECKSPGQILPTLNLHLLFNHM